MLALIEITISTADRTKTMYIYGVECIYLDVFSYGDVCFNYILGGSILQSQGGKPLSLQRSQSVDGGAVTAQQALALQRVQSVDSAQASQQAAGTVGQTSQPTTKQVCNHYHHCQVHSIIFANSHYSK